MTHLAVGYKTLLHDQGRERRTDGMNVHLGVDDVGTLRVNNNLTSGMKTGAGVEMAYDRGGGGTGYIQAYDRDALAFRPLNIVGSSIILSAPSGKVTLPAGTAQVLIASYLSTAAWSTTATGWQETGIQATGTTTGSQLRLEATIVWSHSVAGAGVYFHFYIDGGPWILALATVNNPQANYCVTTSLILYATAAAGAHRFAVGVNNANAGTFSLFTSAASALYVTEQRA